MNLNNQRVRRWSDFSVDLILNSSLTALFCEKCEGRKSWLGCWDTLGLAVTGHFEQMHLEIDTLHITLHSCQLFNLEIQTFVKLNSG